MASPLPFVMVSWNDAWKDSTTDSTFEDADEASEPVQCQTVGWLLRDTPKGVLIANEYSPDGTYRGRTFIPRGMLIEPPVLLNLSKKRVKHAHPPAVSPTV